jgi:hypothetical protein
MGRTYAGILGVIAFLTVLLRGLIDGGSVETTMQTAVASLALMALLGAIIGRLGAWFVEDSIRWQIQCELEAHQRSKSPVRPAERG